MKEVERRVAAVESALSLLECFQEDCSLQLKDFSGRTGMNKSRVLRLLGTLEAAGFLSADPATNGYRLGPKVMALGQIVGDSYFDLSGRARPALERLTRSLGDTTFLSVLRGTQRMALVVEEPDEGVHFAIPEGQLRPLHAGATGKVMLAFAPEHLRQRVLSAPLAGLTAATTLDPQDLARQLDTIRSEKVAISKGEATAHSYAIAVPLLGRRGDLLGALTIAGPVSKLTDTHQADCVAALQAEAEALTRGFV